MFDVTVEGCARLCQVFDESSDGNISRDELIQGLESKGFSNLSSCPGFYSLIERLEKLNQVKTVTAEQLAWILQRTKLETLTNDLSMFDGRCTIQSCTEPEAGRLCTRQYNAKESVAMVISNNDDIRKFFCCDDRRKRIARNTVQWISLDNIGRDADHSNVCTATEQNRRLVLLLAVRFRQHPLSLEKLLSLHSERPKRYVFGRHDFMVVPVWRLSTRSEESFSRYLRSEITNIPSDKDRAETLKVIRPYIEIEESQIAIFNDIQTWNELIHVQSKWYLAAMRIHVSIPPHDHEEMNRIAPDKSEVRLFEDLYKQLDSNYSLLRRGNTEWLQFAILDTISKNLVRVTESLRQLIDFHQDLLHAQQAGYSKKDIYFLQALGDDLENLQRKVRPLRRIVKSIVEENHSDSVKRYLLDTDEDVNNCLLDIDQMLGLVDSLKNEVRTYKEARQSDILYVLTAVTTTFVPAQFLTGVYGMNFFDIETGYSAMPEITWRYGYSMFWCAVIVLQIIVIIIFRRMFKATSG